MTTTKLRTRYKPTQNQVLLHFQFNSLTQAPDESIDTYINRVKEHARQCEFRCTSATCNVRETLIRDRIIMGTHNKNIREDALEKEYQLADLEKQARKIEATETAAHQISTQVTSATNSINQLQITDNQDINAIKHGKYSQHNQPPPRSTQQPPRSKFSTSDPHTACIGCGNNY